MEQIKKAVIEEYWLKKLSGDLPKISLPFLHREKEKEKNREERNVRSFSLNVPASVSAKLKKTAKSSDIALFILFLSGLNIVLSLYTGEDDILVGTIPPVANETDNNIVFCRSLVSDLTVKAFITQTKQVVLEAFKYAECPYSSDDILERLRIQADVDALTVFNVVFILDPFQKRNRSLDQFELVFILSAQDTQLSLQVEYPSFTGSHSTEIVGRLSRNLITAVDGILENLDLKISMLDIIAPEEKQQLLYAWNRTEAEYPKHKTLSQLFEELIEMVTDTTALIYEDWQLTYGELNKKANQLAAYLREKGVGKETIVGILMDRSIEMLVGILGTLKAGSLYLPIDPGYPVDRISFMLKDSCARVLLTLQPATKSLEYNGEIVCMENSEIYAGDILSPLNINDSSDTIYIIYTSGTTGRPKGVMIEHRNVVRLLFTDQCQFDFNSRDVWTMFHSYCFDFSVWEMYGALLFGAKLIVVPQMVVWDMQQYLSFLKRHGVTILNQIPSVFYHLIDEELSLQGDDRALHLRYVIFGGEALKPIKLKSWKLKYPETKLINMFGITETTVHVTYKEITDEEIEKNISNIGRPIPTLTTYVLDKHLRLLPLGVAGELCIGGAGVARGYLNRPELSEVRFVKSPFKKGERLYRSGDQGRLLGNGEMEYLGRIDHQVKIRGFRIELGEIETQLMKHEEIKEAVVLLKEMHLYAYIVAEREFTVSILREYLSKELPDYMIPSNFELVERIPLTPNGKVDREALDVLGKRLVSSTDYTPPRNEVERKILDVWRDVLKLNKIGVHDNYFDLGGTSFDVIRINRKLKEIFKRDIPVVTMFRYTTVHSFANFLNNQDAEGAGIRDRADAFIRGKRDRMRQFKKRKRVVVSG